MQKLTFVNVVVRSKVCRELLMHCATLLAVLHKLAMEFNIWPVKLRIIMAHFCEIQRLIVIWVELVSFLAVMLTALHHISLKAFWCPVIATLPAIKVVTKISSKDISYQVIQCPSIVADLKKNRVLETGRKMHFRNVFRHENILPNANEASRINVC